LLLAESVPPLGQENTSGAVALLADLPVQLVPDRVKLAGQEYFDIVAGIFVVDDWPALLHVPPDCSVYPLGQVYDGVAHTLVPEAVQVVSVPVPVPVPVLPPEPVPLPVPIVGAGTATLTVYVVATQFVLADRTETVYLPFGTLEGTWNEIELPLLGRPGMTYVGAAAVCAEALLKASSDSMNLTNASHTDAIFELDWMFEAPGAGVSPILFPVEEKLLPVTLPAPVLGVKLMPLMVGGVAVVVGEIVTVPASAQSLE